MDPLKMAIMWYGAGFLPRLRALDAGVLDTLLKETQALSLERPLHAIRDKELSVPSWSNVKLTGGEVIALQVFGLWVKCGENEKKAGVLLRSWPIKEALMLVSAKGA